MPTLSIALATYNGAKYLREQLDSIVAQTRPPDELVACDDQSSDGTIEVLREFGERVGFPVRVVRNDERLGYARNFVKAIGLCTGDVIFGCDQDDVWLDSKLARHEAIYLDHEEVGLVVNDGRLVDVDLKPMGMTWFEALSLSERVFRRMETDRAFAVLLRDSTLCGCMMSFRKRLWDRVPPIPPRLGHDDWLAIVYSLISRLRVIREPLNEYRQHVHQVTKGDPGGEPAGPSLPVRAAKMEKRAIDHMSMLAGLKDFDPPGRELRFPDFRDHLKGHAGHFLRRSSMSPDLIRRVPLVAIEFLLGNYGRYNESVKNSLSYDLRPKFYR